jgi:hypothetical protein
VVGAGVIGAGVIGAGVIVLSHTSSQCRSILK